MIEETKLYFREMFRQNRPLREFLDSDWAMLDSRLRQHYGMPPADQMGFQRVALKPEDHRGGLLTQGSILGLTSDGQRHRPVHRGVWLSEVIFNRTPPMPPPNVEPLEPTPEDAPKATIRMQLDAHATHATCASCQHGHSVVNAQGGQDAGGTNDLRTWARRISGSADHSWRGGSSRLIGLLWPIWTSSRRRHAAVERPESSAKETKAGKLRKRERQRRSRARQDRRTWRAAGFR